jgi:predicted enzyme related to lactoylglutathione lyase
VRIALYRIRQVGIDVHDIAAMTDFWSAALGYELDHYGQCYALLRDPAATEPKAFLQHVNEPKLGKNRAHMDIEVPDERAAAERLVGLGACVLWRQDYRTHHWTVLSDPEGNEFRLGYFG